MTTFRFLALIPIASLAILSGCNATQRPLPVVKSSAEYYVGTENYSAAAVDFREYVERRPDDVPMRVGLVNALLQLDQPKDARIHAQVLNDLRPSSDEFADLLARTLYEAGERDAVVSFCQMPVAERGRVADYSRLCTY